jgi:hypothetical protein
MTHAGGIFARNDDGAIQRAVQDRAVGDINLPTNHASRRSGAPQRVGRLANDATEPLLHVYPAELEDSDPISPEAL